MPTITQILLIFCVTKNPKLDNYDTNTQNFCLYHKKTYNLNQCDKYTTNGSIIKGIHDIKNLEYLR